MKSSISSKQIIEILKTGDNKLHASIFEGKISGGYNGIRIYFEKHVGNIRKGSVESLFEKGIVKIGENLGIPKGYIVEDVILVLA